MIYQSSNNCKMYNQYPSKSLGKPQKKLTTYNQNISLEKHHNKEILLKTEAKGFYIEKPEEKPVEGESPRKQYDVGWQSTGQFPFLIMNGQHNSYENKTINSKKKPQIVIQKSQNRGANPQNFTKKWSIAFFWRFISSYDSYHWPVPPASGCMISMNDYSIFNIIL